MKKHTFALFTCALALTLGALVTSCQQENKNASFTFQLGEKAARSIRDTAFNETGSSSGEYTVTIFVEEEFDSLQEENLSNADWEKQEKLYESMFRWDNTDEPFKVSEDFLDSQRFIVNDVPYSTRLYISLSVSKEGTALYSGNAENVILTQANSTVNIPLKRAQAASAEEYTCTVHFLFPNEDDGGYSQKDGYSDITFTAAIDTANIYSSLSRLSEEYPSQVVKAGLAGWTIDTDATEKNNAAVTPASDGTIEISLYFKKSGSSSEEPTDEYSYVVRFLFSNDGETYSPKDSFPDLVYENREEYEKDFKSVQEGKFYQEIMRAASLGYAFDYEKTQPEAMGSVIPQDGKITVGIYFTNAMGIEADIPEDKKIYRNQEIVLTLKNGTVYPTLPDSWTMDAKILSDEKDVNEDGKEFYTVESTSTGTGKKVVLHSLSAGTYRLYVTVSGTDENAANSTSSFDIIVLDMEKYTFDISAQDYPESLRERVSKLSAEALLVFTGEAQANAAGSSPDVTTDTTYSGVLSTIKDIVVNGVNFKFALDLKDVSVTKPKESVASSFSDVANLKSLVLPEELTSVGYNAFARCTALEKVTFGSKIAKIESDGAFMDCTALTTVNIPSDAPLTLIGSKAFRGCTALTDITVPDSITAIGDGAFYQCSKLETLGLSESGTWYFTTDQETWYSWSEGTATPTEYATGTAAPVNLTEAESIGTVAEYNFTAHGITTTDGKVLTVAKCAGDTSEDNNSPVRGTFYLYRVK